MCIFMLVSKLLLLMVFGCESACSGLEKFGFCNGGIAKVNFRRSWNSHDSMIHFHNLGGLLTSFHLDLGAFGVQTCYFACLLASLWRLGGRWVDPGTLFVCFVFANN